MRSWLPLLVLGGALSLAACGGETAGGDAGLRPDDAGTIEEPQGQDEGSPGDDGPVVDDTDLTDGGADGSDPEIPDGADGGPDDLLDGGPDETAEEPGEEPNAGFDAGPDGGDEIEPSDEEPGMTNCGRSTSTAGPWPAPPAEGPCKDYVPGSDPAGSVCDCLAVPSCDRPYVVAHAGGSFLPNIQNRIGIYEESCPQGMDVIETDVHTTKDPDCIYYHNDTIGFVNVSDLTVAQIKAIDPTLITLRESYDWASTRRVFFMQDFKDDASIPIAVQQTGETGMLDRVLFFGSVGENALIKQANPQAWRMLRVQSAEEARAAADDPDPYLLVLHGDREYTDAALVKYVHDRGKRYLIYIDWADIITPCRNFFEMGVDLVQTNDVDRCAADLDTYQAP